MSSLLNKINILDCTLRDGGYYNQWKFDKNLVKNYIESIKESKISIIEIGFRFLSDSKLYGPFAYSKDTLLKSLKIPKKIKVSVMINASDFNEKNLDKQMMKLFTQNSKRYISIIRIACKQNEIPLSIKIAKILKEKGFEIFINLMQINLIKKKKFKDILNLLYLNKNIINCFYFADSFGSMTPDMTKEISKLVHKYWKGDFGIHAHDNCGLALKNTLEAMKNGAKFLDCTFSGMGRGAGNVSTENILNTLIKNYNLNFDDRKVIKINKKYFLKLKKKI